MHRKNEAPNPQQLRKKKRKNTEDITNVPSRETIQLNYYGHNIDF